MNASGSKKMLNICILEIFKEYTDANHKLTQQEIIDLLNKNYDMTCDRKSVKNNILALIEFGYEIEFDKGWYLSERSFEDVELKVLIDSILYSKSLPEGQAKILIDKIKGLSNHYFQKKIKHVCNLPEFYHTDNKQTLYNVELIDEAIDKNRQIAFIYNNYGTDKKLHSRREEEYLVNPYQIVANNSRYYLICNYDIYDDISHYRIDRMTDVRILETTSKPMKLVKGLEKGLNLPKHMAEHIYMFTDECMPIKFKAEKSIIGEIVDWFGKEFTILSEDDKYIIIRLTCSQQAMFCWAMQYGRYVEVVEPINLREKISKTIKNMDIKYDLKDTSIKKKIDQEYKNSKEKTMGKSTETGYINKNNQKNLGRLNERGTDHGQWFYKMECLNCHIEYKANGSDVWLRKCPKCQGGRP